MPVLHHRNTPAPAPTQAATKQYIYADDPFKSVHADMLLRTSDGVEFRVHKAILIVSSSLEEGVLNAIRDSGGRLATNPLPLDPQRRLIFYVKENSATLDPLLRILYSAAENCSIQNIETIFSVLEAARQYQLIPAIKVMRKVVAEYAAINPVRVYVMARQRHWESEMKSAAKSTLGYNIQKAFSQELRTQPYGVYDGLLQYQTACARAASATLEDLGWMERIAMSEGWKPCWSTCNNIPACRESFDAHPRWLDHYLSVVHGALRARPRGGTLGDNVSMTAALSLAFACSKCRGTVFSDLNKFNNLLARKVEEAIDEVVCSS